jgi:FkbM family methyltransferase
MEATNNSRLKRRSSIFTEPFLRLVRLYTFNTPIDKGKYRLFLSALKFAGNPADGAVVKTKDGRKLLADLSTGMQDTLYFLGEYEKAVTAIVERTISSTISKNFLDVGANFGWYTTLFAKLAGHDGSLHSFEPVPSTFDNLKRNFELMGSPGNVQINNLALGDEEAELTINLFSGLATGHASLSTQGRDDAVPFKCRMVTLDSYLEDNNVGQVDFVKVDIEGAELGFLKGAEKLFKQERPPIILMEMALNQTKNFGYIPNDLIEFLRQRAPYVFYRIDENETKLFEIDGFAPDDIGANVICIPNNSP